MGAEKAHYKRLSSGQRKMAFGGGRGEMAVVIGCGMNRLDGTKLVSNVT